MKNKHSISGKHLRQIELFYQCASYNNKRTAYLRDSSGDFVLHSPLDLLQLIFKLR